MPAAPRVRPPAHTPLAIRSLLLGLNLLFLITGTRHAITDRSIIAWEGLSDALGKLNEQTMLGSRSSTHAERFPILDELFPSVPKGLRCMAAFLPR